MIKIVLWGTGKIAKKLIEVIDDKIVFVVDNDDSKWGTIWNGYEIRCPDDIEKRIAEYDKIIIATTSFREIKTQILSKYSIEEKKIDNMYYRHREMFLDNFKRDESNFNEDKQKYFSYIKKNLLGVFNDEFIENYDQIKTDIFFDEDKGLYFVLYQGKRMYFSRKFHSSQMVGAYYKKLLIEQDERSPHRYLTEKFGIKEGDIVLDAGVAEGNFALEIIELVDKIYLIEADVEWIEALKYTFEPYKDKVEIIEAFLGNGEGEISVDEIIGSGRLDFIKMDIEGAEVSALCGAKNTLINNYTRMDICSYHNESDEEDIKQILKTYGYKSDVSEGYMVFVTSECLKKEVKCPKLVRGLVRGYKE